MAQKALQADAIRVTSSTSPQRIAELEPEWRRLHALGNTGFFLSFEWLGHWMRHFGRERKVEVFTVERSGRISLIAPLRFRLAGHGPVRIAMAETIGTRHLPYNDLLFEPDHLEQTLGALVDHLLKRRRVQLLELCALPEESPLTGILERRRGGLQRAEKEENTLCRNRYALIDCDYEAYYEARPKNLRRDHRQGLRRLAEIGPVGTRFVLGSEQDPDAIDAYFELYARSWQKRERWEEFFRGVIQLLSSLGKLRLLFLELDGRPIAAQLGLVDDRILFVLKNFYDESYKRYCPGTVLGFDMFSRVMTGESIREINYMKGDQPYKARWAPQMRLRYDWTIPLGLRGSVAVGLKNLLRARRTGESDPEGDAG